MQENESPFKDAFNQERKNNSLSDFTDADIALHICGMRQNLVENTRMEWAQQMPSTESETFKKLNIASENLTKAMQQSHELKDFLDISSSDPEFNEIAKSYDKACEAHQEALNLMMH